MDFRNALAQSESGGRYGIVNSEGYAGKYQFGDDRLTDFRRATGLDFTMNDFVASPELQEAAYNWHIADIDQRIASEGLTEFIGQEVGGVPITQNALRSMAHLGGFGGMSEFLKSGGRYNPADSNGTSLSDYGTRFAGMGGGERVTPPRGDDRMRQFNALASMAPRPQMQPLQAFRIETV